MDEPARPDIAGLHTAYGWIAFGCTGALIVADRLIDRGDTVVLHALGIVALLLAPVLFVPPFFQLPKYGRTEDGPYYATKQVVDRGLYAVVRHPQYLGYVLLAVGIALLSQRTVTVALGAGAVVMFYLHALREEAHCVKHLGEQYRTYIQRVPRFNALYGIWRHWHTAPTKGGS